MGKKYIALISLLIILAFIGYIVYDTVTSGKEKQDIETVTQDSSIPDQWFIFNSVQISDGKLHSVTVSEDGAIFTGGDEFVSCYNPDLTRKWILKSPSGISALSVDGDTIYAASSETIYLISNDGKPISEWGPYEANSIITSISASGTNVAFADAGNKRIFILKKNGEVVSMIGQSDKSLIIPSPYFDVALYGENKLYLANTGNRRIEIWTTGGSLLSQFGEPGAAPEAFCGCCNPAHFAVIPQGFVTAEKGINRIKILDPDGRFVEFVSSKNSFTPSVPLDVASADGKTIYAANPADSKLYVYKRR
jgi:DNA-binding beta-propeller fold protein YncE